MTKKEYKQNQLQSFKKAREWMESNPVVIAYNDWLNYSPADKADLYSRWNKYYEICGQSRASQIFHEMREAIVKHDGDKMRQLRAENDEIISNNNFLRSPTEFSPYEFTNGGVIRAYLNILDKLKQFDGEGYVSQSKEYFTPNMPYKD